MVPTKVVCESCGSETEVRTYRTFVLCPYCGNRTPFGGFEYRKIDWKSSMYARVRKWTDCPSCRSPNMYLGPERRGWKCPDCGYLWTEKERRRGVLWFCDECETYLNVQDGFSTESGKWKCSECGFVNDVSEDNIL